MGSQTLFRSRPAASLVKPLPMSCRHGGQILVDGRAVAQLDAADRPALAQHEGGVMSVVPFPRLGIPSQYQYRSTKAALSGSRSVRSV